MFKIACQTITFGPEMNKNNMDEVMKSISESLYKGIEIGFRHLDCDRPDYYSELLKKYDLEMVALHLGGDYTDQDSVKKQLDSVHTVIEMAHKLSCPNIFISGAYKKDKLPEMYLIEAENYNKLGGIFQQEGLILSYHNHNWEFENDGHGFKTIINNTDSKNISFVPDVGWITRAGFNPVEVLSTIKDRITNIHFKEFDNEANIVELGKGIVDFPGVYDFIKEMGDMWIIAEQDKTTIGAIESISENYKYINTLQQGMSI